ncbi:MAG: InlB B-repeat-containing protein [Roseburia sp.]|nr:InlB B-repeat-containing protein [Roseburia sp.]
MRGRKQFLAIALAISMLFSSEGIALYASEAGGDVNSVEESAEAKVTLLPDMVSELSVMTYTGTTIEPQPVVSYMGTILEKDVDYTVTYENNVNIGTATAVITGIGSFEGTARKQFKIQAKGLETGFVSDIKGEAYTGEAIRPEVVLSYNGIPLQKNIDYRISFANNTEVGTATVEIKGRGNFIGTLQTSFEIVGANLNEMEAAGAVKVLLEGSEAAYQVLYTGDPIEPEVTVELSDGSRLLEGKDFTIAYENHIAPGTATVKVTGVGNYGSVIEKTFTIGRRSMENATVESGQTMTVLYTPSGQKPVPRVNYNGKRLVEGVDYTVVYYLLDEQGARSGQALEKVTAAGTYELVLVGKDTCEGEFAKAVIVTVKHRSLIGGAVEARNVYARYDGVNVEADYAVTCQNHILTEGTDYEVSEIRISDDKKYATFVFSGKGNYYGQLLQEFTLIAEDAILLSEDAYQIAEIAPQTYTGARICPVVSVTSKDGNTMLTENVDYRVSYRHNLNAGTATVTVTGMGKCVGTMSRTFVITAADVGMVTETEETQITTGKFFAEIDANVYTYNATMQKPQISVKMNGVPLKAGTDYVVDYLDEESNRTDSKDAGLYKAVITLQGNYAGTFIFEYEILPLEVNQLQFGALEYLYSGTEILPTIEELEVTLGDKVLDDAEKAGLEISNPQNNKEVSANAEVTISGKGNYTGEIRYTFSITTRSISDETLKIVVGEKEIAPATADTGYMVEWTGEAQTPAVEIWNGEEKLVSGEDYTLTYRYNTDIGTARVIISGKGNYQGSRVLFFEIVGLVLSEEKGYELSIDESSFVYSGKSMQPAVTVKKGETVLTQGTDYSVSYRNNINAGTAKVLVTGIGYYAGTMEKEFSIVPKTLDAAATVNISSISRQRYTGKMIVPAVTIELDGERLVKGRDYTVAVLDGVEVGTATLIATGIENYAGELATFSFEIYKTTITYVLNGGVNSADNPDFYTAEDKITFANPTRDDYDFMGWYSDDTYTKRVRGIEPGTEGNITLYAKWEPIQQAYGIDVSKWQNQANSSGAINWHLVKQDGKKFSMIRLSYGTTLDPYFEYNYSGAREAGVKVGVYCYNTATTVEAAVSQANYVVAQLNGRILDYPVCLDMEGDTVGALTDSLRTDIVFAFKNVVEAAGYDFILYANKNWLDNYFDNPRLAPLDLWIARYCDFNLGHRYTGSGNVRIWQYSDSGVVNGINGLVDLDICYQDYPKKY